MGKGIDFQTYKGSKSGRIVEGVVHRDTLVGDETLIRITHSGLCGTDEHYRHTDQCLGHEGVGVIEQLGPDVKELRVGEIVGFGYQHAACGVCDQCLTGYETFCSQRVMYGYGDFEIGSMGSHTIFRESFLCKIPQDLSSEDAAPLMCGGATVFNVLDFHGVRPTDRVGIIGVGGLGHLAIQFAAKWGCEVVVFSGTDSKKEEALRLGAHEFHATKGVSELSIKAPINHLLVTASVQVPWELYLPLLAPHSTIYPLSVSNGDFKIPYMPLLEIGLRIQASLVSTRAVTRRMFAFAVLHGIRPMTVRYDMDKEGIEKCFKDLSDGKMRYRGVICAKG